MHPDSLTPYECELIADGIAELIGTDPDNVVIRSNGNTLVRLTTLTDNGFITTMSEQWVLIDDDTLAELGEVMVP